MGRLGMDVHVKTQAMFFKPQVAIKRMGSKSFVVGRQDQLVAVAFSGQFDGFGHHGATDALSLVNFAHHHILNNGRGRALMGQVVHDQQGKGAYD
jgi:hypothetical protein